MTFWGIEVKPGKPYTHQYNKDGGRLHISQATLSCGGTASTKRSVVQCNVGKSRPVLLCSLLPDKHETCPLDLEFHDDEEVIFSVLGPHSIYLTGYYLNLSRHHLNRSDDDSDSYGEDIAETESDPSRYSNEDLYDSDDSFINDDDPEEQSPSPQPKAKSRVLDEQSPRPTTGRKEKCNARRKRLKKIYQVSDSDEDKDASQRQQSMKESSTDLNLNLEDEDTYLISSLFRKKTPVKNEKVEKTSIAKTAEDGKQEKAEDDGSRVTCSKRKIDTVIEERKLDQPCNPLLPFDDEGNINSGTPKEKKKKRKEIVDQGKNLEDMMHLDQDQPIGNCKSDVYKENGQYKEIETKSMDEELTIGDELHRKLPNNDMRVIDSHIIGNHEKLKKKKQKANKHKHTITGEDDSRDLESKELYLQIKELDPIISSAHKSNANLEDHEGVIDSLVSENSGILKKNKKSKKKKGDQNEYMTTEDDSKPLQLQEPFLENMKVKPIADVEESSAQPRHEKRVIDSFVSEISGILKKNKKSKKKGDQNEYMITEDDSKPLQLQEPFIENMKVNPIADVEESSAQPQHENFLQHHLRSTSGNAVLSRGVIDSLVSENSGILKKNKKSKKKKGDQNKYMITEADSKPLQLQEPFLENMKVNPIVDVEESSAQPQHENEEKKHKKGDKDKATMTGDDVNEPLQSKDSCHESMELDQQFDSDQRSNAGLQNEIHGLQVDKVLNGNDIRVKRNTKGKSNS
ncbi:hypothetical protein NE237_024974 [Protea cynaroides]|uniref:peptidylprolyl isomerase n=1 Tax=Protea cynaroides TaxID=273540 RepID=A0A9Q0H405_9MAGN|nr:hypothetical protein NE237_024974 [Protea cynaroides]